MIQLLSSALIDRARQFKRERGGNTAVLFAFAIVPIMGLMGGAADYTRVSASRTAMQNALDTTAIMLAHEAPNVSAGQLQTDAKKLFEAQYQRREVKGLTSALDFTAGDTELTLSAAGSVDTVFVTVAGIKSLPFAASSTAKWGAKGLRVALVLDNTGSMASNGKLSALKSATANFLNRLEAAAQKDGDIYVSIIPFVKDVNLGGGGNFAASWVDWTDWDAVCSRSGGGRGRGGRCTVPPHSSWDGCVVDRGNSNGPSSGNYDTNAEPPASGNAATLYAAEDYSECPQGVKGLSYDWAAMAHIVNNMVAAGNTNQGLGLQVGWMSLTGGGPFTVPEETEDETGQAIILLSDGLNTENRWYSNASQIDARQKLTCDNIKKAGITLYTIQVNTSNDPTSTLLQNCATDKDKFYLLTSSTQILSTLDSIATGLDAIYLSQ